MLFIMMANKAVIKPSMHSLRKCFGCRAAKMLGKGMSVMLHELMQPVRCK